MRPRKGWLEVTIGVLSLVALFLGAQVAAGVPGASWALIALGVASAVLFAAFAPRLLHLSPGNPKLRAVWLTLGFLAVLMLGAAVLVLGEEPLTEWLGEERLDALVKLFVFGVIALFVILFGNIAPKIPFNRYMGLRLPWTVTDELTWRVAHRLVGALAWPCGAGTAGHCRVAAGPPAGGTQGTGLAVFGADARLVCCAQRLFAVVFLPPLACGAALALRPRGREEIKENKREWERNGRYDRIVCFSGDGRVSCAHQFAGVWPDGV